MKILFINDYAAPFRGSFITSLIHLSAKLIKEKNHVYYIFPQEMEYLAEFRKYGEVLVILCFSGKKIDLKFIRKVYHLVIKNKIDLIHSNFGFSAFITGTLVSGLAGIKHISHERSLSPKLYFENNYFKKIFKKSIFQLINIFGNNHYIAISNEVVLNLIKYNGYPENKIILIPNAVFKNNNTKGQITIKFDQNVPVVGMIAHMGMHKDHTTFIHAAKIVNKKIPNVHYLLVGGDLVNSKISYRGKYENLIAKLKLENNFTFTGEVANPACYIRRMNIGCLISNWEGFGNAVVEYMLEKKPVIATNVGGLKDIVLEGETGFLIEPGNYKMLAERIIYLLENPSLAKQMGEKGNQKAVKEYNMDTWVDRIIKVYEAQFLFPQNSPK